MPVIPLEKISACVFDAYGTLFDYGSAAAGCRDILGDKFDQVTALWRDKQLQYTWLRTLQNRHVEFWQVTSDALEFTLETIGIEDPSLHERLMNLYLTLDAFPEVPDTLARLKAAGLKTAVLSNGAPGVLKAAIEHAKNGELLDGLLLIGEVGGYKNQPEL